MTVKDELLELVSELRSTFEKHQNTGFHEWPLADFVAPVKTTQLDETIDWSASKSQKRGSLLDAREELGDCTRCQLHKTRKNIVFGTGNEKADLMFIGEAPGADEDAQGVPFVGKAGQLLDKMIVAMGLKRQDVYIANVLKCRPPNNRDPKAEEVSECRVFLEKQILAIRPKVIVTLGKPAAHLILQTKAPLSALRGNWHRFMESDVMPTFHPAYLLRDPRKKKEAWNDLQAVMAKLD